MQNEIPRADVPPSPARARIISVPPGTSFVHLLGKWAGFWVHWVGKRSFPCLEDRCPKSRHWKPAYWVAYFPAAIPSYDSKESTTQNGWEPVVVSANCYATAAIRDNAVGFPCRVSCFRKPTEKAWQVDSVQTVPAKNNLPTCFSVLDVMYRVWGVRPAEDNEPANNIMVDGQPLFPLGEASMPG